MYNSSADDIDDNEYTMMAETYRNEHLDPNSRPRLPQTRHAKTDHYYNDQSLPEWIHEIEQILNFYREELRPESNSQAHVHHQFLLRLIDLIRPHYHQDRAKLEKFDQLFQEIIELYERENVKQRESMDQLKKEVADWQRYSFISNHEPTPRPNVTTINDDLIDLNQSIKQLEGILEKQQSRIKELTELVSSQLTPSISPSDPTSPPPETGTCHQSERDFRQLSQRICHARHPRCMICQKNFSNITDEEEIVAHLIECTNATVRKPRDEKKQKHFICPLCETKLDIRNEQAYLQHLADCYERLAD